MSEFGEVACVHDHGWSPDGRELFYDANPKVTDFEAVSVTTQPTFAFGNAVTVPKLFLMAGAVLRTPYDTFRSSNQSRTTWI